MIAVDAPTLIPNATGMRLPDKLTHKHFRHYHAGCYPANLGRPFAQRTVEFGLSLELRGFTHAPTLIPQIPGRYQIEVYPHPAIVHLFGLTRILKYKKGKLSDRRLELIKLRQYILNDLPHREPTLNLSSLPEIPTTGTALKAIEDQLDSLICAYVAAHWWYWGSDRNWVLGDTTTGYIVVPAPPLSEQGSGGAGERGSRRDDDAT
jgi:predicted RNase H-like nuclease